MSKIQIFHLSIKSGLLAVSVFRWLNWKSQSNFTLSFSKTIPCSHCSLYHIVLAPINLPSFAQAIATIINTLLCLAKHSLLDNYYVFHRFIVAMVYSSPSILNHSLVFFPKSPFHHLFRDWHYYYYSANTQ